MRQSATLVVALVPSRFLCSGLAPVAGDAECLLVGVGVVVRPAGVVDVVDF